jgi:hypothetical protein
MLNDYYLKQIQIFITKQKILKKDLKKKQKKKTKKKKKKKLNLFFLIDLV